MNRPVFTAQKKKKKGTTDFQILSLTHTHALSLSLSLSLGSVEEKKTEKKYIQKLLNKCVENI
jgi:hypothetical protein